MATIIRDRKELKIKLNDYEIAIINKLEKEYKKRNNKVLQIGPYLEELFHLKMEETFQDY